MHTQRSNSRRFGTWIGIYALLLQAMIPFGQALPGPNGAPLVICQVAGYGTTTAPSTPREVPKRGPGVIDAHGCAVCVAVNGPTSTASNAPVLSVPYASIAPAFTKGRDQEAEQQLLAHHFLARAPPLV